MAYTFSLLVSGGCRLLRVVDLVHAAFPTPGTLAQDTLSGHPSPRQNGLSRCCSLLQGSHVTRWPGFYILQWKFHTMPACAATNLPRVDDVLASLQVSSHKCKVMYYTEVIGSEDFRFVPEGGSGSIGKVVEPLLRAVSPGGKPREADYSSDMYRSCPSFTKADGGEQIERLRGSRRHCGRLRAAPQCSLLLLSAEAP